MSASLIDKMCDKLRQSRMAQSRNPVWELVSPSIHRVLAHTVYRNGIWVDINREPFRVDYEYRNLDGYTETVYAKFLQAIEPGMTVFDVGAHFGIYSLGAARRLRHRGTVIAFEPAPAPRRILSRHLRLNGFQDCSAVRALVVAERDGEIDFFAQGHCPTGSVAEDHTRRFGAMLNRSTPVNRLKLPCLRLDSFCAREGYRPDVIKIDVEGSEFQVLTGARETLRRYRPQVLCEVHPEAMRAGGATEDGLKALVADLGYEIDYLTSPNKFGIYHIWMRSKWMRGTTACGE